jgi:methylated-DNA-[protein]-cysteine S-methyltransferase
MTTTRPTTLAMAIFDTALGRCAIRWTAAGISGVELPGATTRRPSPVDPAAPPPFVREAIAGIQAVLAGEARDLTAIPLDEHGIDPFRRRVYAATRTVRPGTTATYGQIARAVGEPNAARDVGAALARNPMPVIVPCHRVVAANGALTGFSAPGGLATKRRMLELEGAPGFGQQRLFG